MTDSLHDMVDKLLKSKIEQRLEQIVEERLRVILGPGGQPVAADKVTVVRSKDPETETYHNRVLIRRIRATDKHPNKRVQVRCNACGDIQTLSLKAWHKGGCRCSAHLKITPEVVASRMVPLATYSENLAAQIKAKLLRITKIGDSDLLSASEWGKVLDIDSDQRNIGRAFRVLARANNEFVISQEAGRKWRVERMA